MRSLCVQLQILLLLILPLAVTAVPVELISDRDFKLIWLVMSPLTFVLATIAIGGLLSRIGLPGLVAGKFERNLTNTTYFLRRLHATPWTFIFYFKPVYFLILSLPFLKWMTFRLFGYQGKVNFTVYPDTWLRDLPLLDIGSGAYLSNKASIATNICLMDGQILVEGITIGEKSCVGHGTLIGPGTRMGKGVELGANITSGIRVIYGNNIKVFEICGIHHGSRIEDNVTIEAGVIIGLRSRIGSGIRIREGSHIHAGTRLKTQKDADVLFSKETGALTLSRERVLRRVLGQSHETHDQGKFPMTPGSDEKARDEVS